jgi:uncharacterized lipoprotein YmbA
MKKLLSIIFAFTLTACASDRITATLTVSSIPSAGNTFVPNAKTLTWATSTTASPGTLVLIGASIGASATNLFRQLAAYPLTGPVDIAFSSSNIITLRGQISQALSATISGAWASISYSTQTVAEMKVVRVPFSGEPTAGVRVSNASQLAIDMGTHSTTAFAAGTTLVGNLLQTTGDQTATGTKTFANINVAQLESSGEIHLTRDSPTVFFEDGNGAASVNTTNTILIVSRTGVQLRFYDDTLSISSNILVIPRIGYGADYAQFNTKVKADSFFDSYLINDTIQNSTLALTNTVSGAWQYSRTNVSSLANGSNAGLDFGGKVYVKIKAGPTGAFAINGIAGGADGRVLIIDNSIAQNMTIANDSGTDPVAANRIYTRTGADVTTAGQGVVTLIYDSEDSRWIVVSVRD